MPKEKDIIGDLYFKYYLNKDLKKKTFDILFEDDSFLSKFLVFLDTRIGKIWLRSEQGLRYKRWMNNVF